MPDALVKTPGLQETLAGDQLLVTPSDGGELVVLNRTAAMVLSMVGLRDPEGMTAVLHELYPDDTPEQLRRDVEECLRHLEKLGLVKAL